MHFCKMSLGSIAFCHLWLYVCADLDFFAVGGGGNQRVDLFSRGGLRPIFGNFTLLNLNSPGGPPPFFSQEDPRMGYIPYIPS